MDSGRPNLCLQHANWGFLSDYIFYTSSNNDTGQNILEAETAAVQGCVSANGGLCQAECANLFGDNSINVIRL